MSRAHKVWFTIIVFTSIALDVPEFVTAFREGPDWDFFFVGDIIFGFLGLGMIAYIWTRRKLRLVSPS